MQGAVQVLSIKEAKESSSAGDSPQQQRTTNVQARKSALDDLLHSDTDSQTEDSDNEMEESEEDENIKYRPG